jgi:hypothetical protein
MKTINLFLCPLLFFLMSCTSIKKEIRVVKGLNYELRIAPKQKAILVLFSGFSENIQIVQAEATFLQNIENEGVTILFLDVNKKLWLSDEEKTSLSEQLNLILELNKIGSKNIFIGGFSSGGNLAFLLGNHILETKSKLQLKGVFVIDSPLDIEKLYSVAKDNIAKNASEDSYNEGLFLTNLLGNALGEPLKSIEKYKKVSPYLASLNYTQNIDALKNIKVRLYSEPDLDWQKKYRNRDYQDLNAAILEKLYHSFLDLGAKNIDFIQTKNKGFRADGTRHPHSWSIVDKKELIEWIFK